MNESTKQPIKMIPGDDTHLTMLMAPSNLNFFIGKDREDLLAYGRAAFEAGKAGQCLHQIQEPAAAEQAAWHAGLDEVRAQAAPAAVAVPDGWQLVPMEGTEEMARAFRAESTPALFYMTTIQCADFQERYRAMLGAAPALAATPAAVEADREDFAWLVVQEACETEPADEDDPDCIRILRRDLKTAVLAAFLRGDTNPTAAAPVVLPEPVGAMSATTPRTVAWNCMFMPEAGTKLYTEQQVRALLAGVSAPAAEAVEPLDIVQAAADAASVGHLSHLLDHQSGLLARAMAAMKAMESTASPFDESDGDLDARIPYEAWASFVDARASLLHDVKQSPVAPPQAQADARDALTPAARDVLAERARQITAEGYEPEADDIYTSGELASASATYALLSTGVDGWRVTHHWPWGEHSLKLSEPRRMAVKSAALALAEIERIDRAAIAAAKGESQ